MFSKAHEWISLGGDKASGANELLTTRAARSVRFSALDPALLVAAYPPPHPQLDPDMDVDLKPFKVRAPFPYPRPCPCISITSLPPSLPLCSVSVCVSVCVALRLGRVCT